MLGHALQPDFFMHWDPIVNYFIQVDNWRPWFIIEVFCHVCLRCHPFAGVGKEGVQIRLLKRCIYLGKHLPGGADVLSLVFDPWGIRFETHQVSHHRPSAPTPTAVDVENACLNAEAGHMQYYAPISNNHTSRQTLAKTIVNELAL